MRRLIAAMVLAAVAAEVPAATYCVGTVTELESALAAAAASPQDDEIRVREGFYQASQPLTYNSPNSGWMFVVGGYFPTIDGPCFGRNLNAGSTVLDGAGLRQVLRIFFLPPSPPASGPRYGVDNLTIQNGAGAGFTRGGGVALSSTAGVQVEYWLDNLIVRNNSGYFGGGIDAYATRGLVKITNSLFVGNSAPTSAFGHLSTVVTASDGNYGVSIANSTFVNGQCQGNGSRGCGIGISVGGNVRAEVINSVFWNNAISDVNSEGQAVGGFGNGTVYYSHSRIPVSSGPLVPTITMPIVADPGFVNPTLADFRLRNDSLLINRGLGTIPVYSYNGFDLDGSIRVRSGVLDVGAFENQPMVFGDGFEAPAP